MGCFRGVLGGGCVLGWVRVTFLGEAWVQPGLGKGGCTLWVILQGRWRLVPLPTCSGPAYHLPVSGGPSERLLGFRPGVCAGGSWETRGAGGWPRC